MSMKIIRAGLLTTVQDTGRPYYQGLGVSPAGAMDTDELRLANLLLNNEENAAALEITLIGPVIEFTADSLIALTGADLSPQIDGRPVKMYRPVAVKKGARLSFAAAQAGFRTYLAIAGGIDVPLVLGSRSTYLYAAFGGFGGRALKAGDELRAGAAEKAAEGLLNKLVALSPQNFKEAGWGLYFEEKLVGRMLHPLRVTAGPQYDAFSEAAKTAFFSAAFTISSASDRMGARLTGPKITLKEPLELYSDAVVLGAVQVPAGGEPIILAAEHQTTGGYPVIACVSRTDIGKLAQLRPGSSVRFKLISLKEAQALYIERETYFRQVKAAVAEAYGREMAAY